MREVERIASQLRAAVDGPAWHGPSVMESLEGIEAKHASARPIAGAHSIGEIAHHIAGWMEVVRLRMEGQTVDEPTGGDFPDGKIDEATWKRTLDRLRTAHEALQTKIAQLADEELEQPLGSGRPSRYVFLHGTVQHNLYHAGQIGILRKAVL